jgi:hypothetical protein
MEPRTIKFNTSKNPLALLIMLLCFVVQSLQVRAQSNEAQQLLLNVEKLAQLKNILTDMEKGYQIISNGYNAVRDISQGNFSIHQIFLNALITVSPEVKKYKRVAEILSDQKSIIKQYQRTYNALRAGNKISIAELSYVSSVYQKLLAESTNDLNDLATVITSSSLRMSDDERLQAIDQIYSDMNEKLQFVQMFNQQASLLALQRDREQNQHKVLSDLYKLKH